MFVNRRRKVYEKRVMQDLETGEKRRNDKRVESNESEMKWSAGGKEWVMKGVWWIGQKWVEIDMDPIVDGGWGWIEGLADG